MDVTNTLAYYDTATITAVTSIMGLQGRKRNIIIKLSKTIFYPHKERETTVVAATERQS
jgi:hypothetical protein